MSNPYNYPAGTAGVQSPGMMPQSGAPPYPPSTGGEYPYPGPPMPGPPQGYPPQGIPPNGTHSQGVPPHGMPYAEDDSQINNGNIASSKILN